MKPPRAGDRFTLRAVLACLLGASLGATAAPAPYPPSPTLAGVEFDFSTHRRLAPGSDNWPTTWAGDGHLYTAWGDGGGFGGTNSKGRVFLGIARVEGEADAYTGRNLWGGFEPVAPARFGGKSYGILAVDGLLYLWVAPQPNPHLAESRLAWSADLGVTWQLADWMFPFADGLTVPTFLNFGRDYAGARDGYVYSYYIEPAWGPGRATATPAHTFDVHRPGRIHLSRTPKGAILDRNRYEFYAGTTPDGTPVWTTEIARKRPVFEDANGVGWNLSVSHNAGLRRYLLSTEHTETHAGKFGLFDAPEPWGPWSTVAYDDAWGAGHVEVSTFYWNFPTKWLSADGRDFTLVFTGKNTNDSWNTVKGRFRRHDVSAPAPGSAPPPARRPHPAAIPSIHAPGEVDRPELVPFIVGDPARLRGIVVDETEAELRGAWQYSTHTPPYVGFGYLHDQREGKGAKSATFTPTLPRAGRYEVRLAHCYNIRRATNTPVTIHHADGETVVRINQQEEPPHGRLWRTLGTFRFAEGRAGWVRIGNDGTDGKYVIADAVQFLPVQ